MICVGMAGAMRASLMDGRYVGYTIDPMRCGAELWTQIDPDCLQGARNDPRFEPGADRYGVCRCDDEAAWVCRRWPGIKPPYCRIKGP